MMTLTLAAREGLAQPYPAKPIRIVMPFSTGGTDLVTRWLALKLAPAVGQQIVPEPRTGAGGNIGHELVAKATEGKNIDKMALFNEMMADPGFRAKIAKTYSIFQNKLESIKYCLARFDEETKAVFLDSYTKIDAKAEETPVSNPTPTPSVNHPF